MGKQTILTKEQEEQIIYNYSILHMGQRASGKFIPVGDRIVKKVLAKYDIPIRSGSEARTIYGVKNDYFKNQTPNMAYWLGILGSDGCVASSDNCVYIELQRSDRELLEKLNKSIGNERAVKDYITKNGYENSKLYFYSKEIKDDLATYSVIPNKTYSSDFLFPHKLRPEFYPDYIRGLFDGDGCIKMTGYSITWQVDCPSLDVIKTIQSIFSNIGIDMKIAVNPKVHVNLYRLYGYTKEKCIRIYNYLYGTPSDLFLARKKTRFEELLLK